MNPQRTIKDGSLPFTDSLYWTSSASSLHPGGANFAMLDGSVRFIKDTINCWSIDPATNLPPGLSQGGDPVLYSWGPDLRLGRVSETLHPQLRRFRERRRLLTGRTDWSPLPPNRAGGFPAHGSPVGGLTSERIDRPVHRQLSSYTAHALQRICWASVGDRSLGHVPFCAGVSGGGFAASSGSTRLKS